MSQPSARACPFTAQTSGFPRSKPARPAVAIARRPSKSAGSIRSPRASACDAAIVVRMSMPPQKTRSPAPVSTAQRISSSPAIRSHAAASSRSVGGSSELARSRRSIVTSATWGWSESSSSRADMRRPFCHNALPGIGGPMDFEWEPEQRAFIAELRAFIREWRTPELLAEYQATYGAGGPELSRFRAALEQKGWARMCWPVEQGGQGRNLLYQFLFVEEMEYWGMPYGNLTYTSIGPSIQHFGSEEQKRRWLPGIWSGEYTFAIGYSEPNAGTDLASLRTRAVRVGDEWVINGQKVWTSLADVATHIWLAVRTDPDLPKHQGISVFVVPTDVPGLTIRPLHAMYGGHTCETFYDDVRVPH